VTWTWSELSSDVRYEQGVQITVGRTDESTQVGATRVALTLDNRTGDYSPRNPAGANYGLLAKGTPIEVRVTRILDTFTRSGALGTDADSGLTWTTVGSTWATTGTAATSALGSANTFNQATVDAGGHDVDVTHVSSISAVTTGAAWVDATIVRRVDNDNYYRLHTEFGTGGIISCKIMRVLDGATITLADTTSTGVSYSAGTVIATRARAVGARLQVRAWLDSGDEPTTWTCEADDDAVTGTEVGLYEWRVNGNTNVGTLTCTIDNFQSDVIRATVPVPEWPVRWDKSGNDVTAPIAGAGILSRLAQGQTSQRSALYRQLIGQNPHGYWPLEDGSNAVVGASAVARGRPATQAGASFGSSDVPGGSSASVTLNSFSGGSRITGGINSPPVTGDGYAGMALFKLGSAPGSSQNLIRFFGTGAVYQWQIAVSATNFGISGVDVGSSSIVSTSVAHSLTLTDWFAVQLETEENGANVDWALIWHQVGSTGFLAATGSYAGTAETITGWTATAPVDDTQVCHVWLGDNDLPFVDATFLAVAAGYAGETAGARLERLCAEEGFLLAVLGDVADTAPMGVQPFGTFLELARECEAADQGVLYERGAGLGYLTRTARYNGTPVLELDFDDGHIAEPPEPVDDDQQLRNRVKLKRSGGSEETVGDEASIAESGVYPDDLTVNLQVDAQLLPHASWRLHLGTHGELRWPRIELNLASTPELIGDWCKVRIGSRITIANPPDPVAGGSLDLIVEGWTETLGTYQWDVMLVCSPAKPWDVGVYSSTPYDGDATTTTGTLPTGTVGQTGVSLPITTTNRRLCWSTTAVPYPWDLNGEIVTVTAMSAAAGTVGAFTQTATITRGAGGLVKSHASGEQPRLADPARWAL
jgi:hypothetical protein